ncbi:glycosyltransferase family 2 protein [Sedimentitalea sp. JM2-8]|uniref:Glycosyltransferase family 2 protein n=1 Tax=Sedimentitalea xiamensis TaxID=3050037 RepID=A0ABT7F9Z4_9RHOB|nr:glycosyltransferase family 2 protein [Sedimentitalea xiamensis]MDK3071938.1 glycosyltransferase family 2 protein [Sedimentitalea xiamensis]
METLEFAAFHLHLGAHRLYLYLDAPEPRAHAFLKAHPKVRVATCDATHWRRIGEPRPRKHQVRQVLNATHAYGRAGDVDWLAHIDVDEFLWCERSIGSRLADLPRDATSARVRPVEALAGDGTAFKAFIPGGADRDTVVRELYPDYGAYVKGGFLSHLAGKVFVRTGLPDISLRIHNVYQGGDENPNEVPLDDVDLCHFHVRNWDQWISAYRFRLLKGSYRMNPAKVPSQADGAAPTLHRLLRTVERDRGRQGLRDFFETLCADTQDHRDRLAAKGLLRLRDLNLAEKRRRHFPTFDPGARISGRGDIAPCDKGIV